MKAKFLAMSKQLLIKLHKYNTKPATLGIKVAGYFLTALDMI